MKPCCDNCKKGKKCRSEQKKWVEVYKKGADADKIPFRGVGDSKAKPKGCKNRELHARTLTGKKFNFAGPNTCFRQRIARGDKPITYSDACAKLHDYWYDKKDATREQIKRADDDFVRCVKASPNYRVGDNVNKKLMTSVFEDVGGLQTAKHTNSSGGVYFFRFYIYSWVNVSSGHSMESCRRVVVPCTGYTVCIAPLRHG